MSTHFLLGFIDWFRVALLTHIFTVQLVKLLLASVTTRCIRKWSKLLLLVMEALSLPLICSVEPLLLSKQKLLHLNMKENLLDKGAKKHKLRRQARTCKTLASFRRRYMRIREKSTAEGNSLPHSKSHSRTDILPTSSLTMYGPSDA